VGLGVGQRRQELQPVAEAVIEVEAPVPREVRVGLQAEAVGVQVGSQAVQVLDEDAGVGLAGGAEAVLDAEAQLQRAGPELDPAAVGQCRWLGDLGKAEHAGVEGARAGFGAGWHGELHVVERERCWPVRAHAVPCRVAAAVAGCRR